MVVGLFQLPLQTGVTVGAWVTVFDSPTTTAATETQNVVEWITLN